MRGISICSGMLLLMAITDFWFSSRLLAGVRTVNLYRGLAEASTASNVDLVEQALNARYMQWGAVGVMLMLFVWIITKHFPNLEKRRDAERREEREAFLKTLQNRDSMYLTALSEIRQSVEAHSDRHNTSKDTLSSAVHELTLEIRNSR